MSDEHFDDVQEILLPAKLFRRSVGIAFDVGGSRCKVAFKKKQTENGRTNPSDDHVTVVLAGFSRHRLTDALQFVKKNADYSLERLDDGCQRQKLHITGVFYSQKFASAVETELSLSSGGAAYKDEFAMEANAINSLMDNVCENDLFYALPASPWTIPAADSENSLQKTEKCQQQSTNGDTSSSIEHLSLSSRHAEPYLILCYGSATGITLVSEDGTSSLVNGCPEGGVSLLALSKLLVGTDDFAEFMRLAECGDTAKVSTTAEACQQELNEPSYFDCFPREAVVHAFGNTLNPDYKGKPEDMARAILMNAIQNTASMTVWTAMAKNCRTVYMCGGVFEHQLPRELFSFFCEGLALYFGKTVMKCHALKNSSYLPVLGAILDDSRP